MTNAYQCGDGRWIMLCRQAICVADSGQGDRAVGPAGRSTLRRRRGHQPARRGVGRLCSTPNSVRSPWRIGKRPWTQARIPYGIIQTPEEAAADPQLRAAGIVVPIEGARDLDYTVNNPITLRGLDRVPSRRAPEHGEHNDDVLAQLGFSAAEIAQLRKRKVIPAAAEQETVR